MRRLAVIGLVGLVCVLAANWSAGMRHAEATTSLNPQWVVQAQIGTNVTISDMAFSDTMNGWAVGSDGTVFVTHDGGLTWARVSVPHNGGFGEVFLSYGDATHITIMPTATGNGEAEEVYSNDAGHTWNSYGYSCLTDVSSVTASTVFVSTCLGIYVSTDQGKTLHLEQSGSFREVTFPTASSGWAVDYSGGLWHTADGQTWSMIDPGIKVAWLTFAPTTSVGSMIVARGFSSGLVISTDSGVTWTTAQLPTTDQLTSVHFASATEGIASTATDILVTHDGGRSWQEQTIPVGAASVEANPIVRVGYYTPVGPPFAVTRNGTLLHFGALPAAVTPTPQPTDTPVPTDTATPADTPSSIPSDTPAPRPTTTPRPSTLVHVISAKVVMVARHRAERFQWQPFPHAAFYNLQVWLVKPAAGQNITAASVTNYAVRFTGTIGTVDSRNMPRGSYEWRMAAADARGTLISGWTKTFTLVLQ